MQQDLFYPIRQEQPGKCSLSRELHLPELDRGGWMVLKRLDPLAPHLTRYFGAHAPVALDVMPGTATLWLWWRLEAEVRQTPSVSHPT